MKCKNCDTELKGQFCLECGQRASVKRFTLVDLFSTDFLLGLFSLERSKFLFTVKMLFSNPGKMVRDYIAGKRVRTFHFFTFLIIIITIYQILEYLLKIDFLNTVSTPETAAQLESFLAYTKQHLKIFTLAKIPIGAAITYFIFQKANFNFAEHLVLNTFLVSAEGIIRSLMLFPLALEPDNVTLSFILGWIPRIYTVIFFYSVFWVFFERKLHPFLFSIASLLLIMIFYVLLILYPAMLILS
ncbi:MAG: DUF3667 domain-containing protein [Bacteroidota bacterium]